MGIILTDIIEDKRLSLGKEEDSTQHILSTPIVDEVWAGLVVSGGDAEMVIPETFILAQIGLGPRERKDAGLPVMAHLIAG